MPDLPAASGEKPVPDASKPPPPTTTATEPSPGTSTSPTEPPGGPGNPSASDSSSIPGSSTLPTSSSINAAGSNIPVLTTIMQRSGIPVAIDRIGVPFALGRETSLAEPGPFTLYIPYVQTLPTQVNASHLVEVLAAVAPQDFDNVDDPIVEQPATPDGGLGSSRSTSSPTLANVPMKSQTGGGKEKQAGGSGIPAGALAGAVVGGFLLGLLVYGIFARLKSHRRRRQVASAPTRIEDPRKRSIPDGGQSDTASRGLEKDLGYKGFETSTTLARAVSAGGHDLMGWQKHLPQDKDDGTMTKVFSTLFGQVQMHVECYYQARPTRYTRDKDSRLAALATTETDLIQRSMHDSAMALLQAILSRWIVHRISLHCDTEQSLLPQDYLQIPKDLGWSMERTEGENRRPVEKGRGIVQALAQWRRLTSFLRPDPMTDYAFQQALSTKIETDSLVIVDAFSPWEKLGKSRSDLLESLRQILHGGADAGILLFAQPSTFSFDWTVPLNAQARAVTITPAFVKTYDEKGQPLRPVQVLVEPMIKSV